MSALVPFVFGIVACLLGTAIFMVGADIVKKWKLNRGWRTTKCYEDFGKAIAHELVEDGVEFRLAIETWNAVQHRPPGVKTYHDWLISVRGRDDAAMQVAKRNAGDKLLRAERTERDRKAEEYGRRIDAERMAAHDPMI